MTTATCPATSLEPDLPWQDLDAPTDHALPLVVNGVAVATGAVVRLPSPGDPGTARSVVCADANIVDRAIVGAEASRSACAALSRAQRAAILRAMSAQMVEGRAAIARSLALEVGKALRDCEGEVDRCAATLATAADAVTALIGAEIPVDAVPVGEGRIGFTVWQPVGVISAICGFNFPLLLAVHKVSAAIGAGCPVVVKPSDRTPFTTLVLARAAVVAGWPPAAISVLNGGPDVSIAMIEHPDVKLVSFTGSSAVGALVAERAGRHLKRVILELGSNAATIVAADADLDLAAQRCAAGAMGSTGQSCISVQRIIAERSIAADLAERIAENVRRMHVGDPLDRRTDVGYMVSEDEASRVAALIHDATDKGAELVIGGVVDGLPVPTILAGVPPNAALAQREAFGPVAAIFGFETLDEAIALANSTPYGLMAGVFTRSIETAMRVARSVEAGGVHVNDSSNFRPDNMPYGGVKHSGIGKEGPAYAMREMSVEKVITLRVEGDLT